MRLSVSKIKAFKSCRRLYQLKYIEGLVPAQTPESLKIGKSYHELIDWLNKHGNLDDVEEEHTKAHAMATAYMKYIYPKFKVVESEKWFEYSLGGNHKLVGIADAIADDGHIVEHKTTGSEITEQYEYNLMWDEQILAYMLMTGRRKVWYTVCRKPTIRQRQNETDDAFYERMVEWYDIDTDAKIRLLEIERTDDEVAEYKEELYKMLYVIICATDFYRNSCHCNMWGRRCEYSSICMHYDKTQEYVEFVKKEDEYEPAKD